MALTFGCVLSEALFGPLAGPEALRALVQHAESEGFDSVWFADHVVIPRQVESNYPYAADGASPFDPDQPFYEPLSALNFLAGCTRKIRLGTHVLIIPYREPVHTAKILATIDALSGGRLTLGAGAGWMEEEFKAVGAPPFAERGAVTDEYLRLFKALWTQDQPTFKGKYREVSDIGFCPKPIQKPHPPIWIGGHSKPALRRVARLGDGWMPIGLRPPSLLQPEGLSKKISQLRSLLDDAGRSLEDIAISLTVPVVFAEVGSSSRLLLQGQPEQIANDFRLYMEVGVTNFNINLPAPTVQRKKETMSRFAHEVMPLLS